MASPPGRAPDSRTAAISLWSSSAGPGLRPPHRAPAQRGETIEGHLAQVVVGCHLKGNVQKPWSQRLDFPQTDQFDPPPANGLVVDIQQVADPRDIAARLDFAFAGGLDERVQNSQ